MLKKLTTLVFLAVVIGGCTSDRPDYTRDGVSYGTTEGVFRGRWWSYCERGESFAAGGFNQEAIADFQKALEGRSRDTWQARTYGLHFVEYFPNRELGIVYFREGSLDNAEQCLRTSLEHVDTARAHEYLDKVLQVRLAQGDLTDAAAPSLSASVEKGALLADPAAGLRIQVQDDLGVTRVAVNGRPSYQRGSAESLLVEETVYLGEGKHSLHVDAVDLAGKTVVQDIAVEVDLSGPNVGIREPQVGLVTTDATVTIQGVAADANGVASLVFDPAPVAGTESFHPGERAPFSASFALQDGENAVVIAAKDRAGNETRSVVKVYRGERTAAARLWQIGERRPSALVAADNAGGLASVLASAAAVEAEPRIELKSPDPGRPYRHNRTLRVAGEVIGDRPIVALAINGESCGPLTGSPRESFNKRVPLGQDLLAAENATITVTVQADDEQGRRSSESVNVALAPVTLNTRKSRMPIAVLAFTGGGDALAPDLRALTEQQIVETERFNVVDRHELQTVLTEQQLSEALGDKDAALQLGKVIPAQAFLVADIIERGAEAEIAGRVISTETSEILATVDANVSGTSSMDALRAGCRDLARQLAATFPRLSGEVLGVRGGEMLINWTVEDGVREGMHLLVVHKTEPWLDEATGEVLAPGDAIPIGEAAITSVTGAATRAETIPRETQEGAAAVEKGMPAITM